MVDRGTRRCAGWPASADGAGDRDPTVAAGSAASSAPSRPAVAGGVGGAARRAARPSPSRSRPTAPARRLHRRPRVAPRPELPGAVESRRRCRCRQRDWSTGWPIWRRVHPHPVRGIGGAVRPDRSRRVPAGTDGAAGRAGNGRLDRIGRRTPGVDGGARAHRALGASERTRGAGIAHPDPDRYGRAGRTADRCRHRPDRRRATGSGRIFERRGRCAGDPATGVVGSDRVRPDHRLDAGRRA